MGVQSRIGCSLLLIGVCASVSAQQSPFDHQPDFLDALDSPQSAVIAQTLTLNSAELALLSAATIGQEIDLPALSAGLAKGSPMAFKRINIHAPGTRVTVDDGVTVRQLDASGRHFFLAHSATGGASFSLDLKSGRAHGLLVDGANSYQIDGEITAKGGLNLTLASLREARSKAGFACGQNDTHKAEFRAPADLDSGLIGLAADPAPSMRATRKGSGQVLYQTVIAVDTDNELLYNKFDNNPAEARDWIEDMFVAMNAFYEPDLGLRLLLGDLLLRVDNTPTDAPDFNTDPDDFNDGLGSFRSYFQNNQNSIQRNFAALLSGKNIGRNSFSGVAYVGVYCNSASYSLNRIGSNSRPAFIAGGVGHEIGHNLGSSHTHCEARRAGGGFVDECYSMNPASPRGCYVGPTSCPAGGADGSLMSYCHAGASGFDGDGPEMGTSSRCSNSDYFHPLIIGKLDDLIASNNPSCIADFDDLDLLFRGGFE
ncbi:MAG: M12 family metallo-peptidase [Lysobacterales bacterium]